MLLSCQWRFFSLESPVCVTSILQSLQSLQIDIKSYSVKLTAGRFLCSWTNCIRTWLHVEAMFTEPLTLPSVNSLALAPGIVGAVWNDCLLPAFIFCEIWLCILGCIWAKICSANALWACGLGLAAPDCNYKTIRKKILEKKVLEIAEEDTLLSFLSTNSIVPLHGFGSDVWSNHRKRNVQPGIHAHLIKTGQRTWKN